MLGWMRFLGLKGPSQVWLGVVIILALVLCVIVPCALGGAL